MAKKIIPPKSVDDLKNDLKDPSLCVYLCIGEEDDYAWLNSSAELNDYPRTICYLTNDKEKVDKWLYKPGVSGWPENSKWNGGSPKLVCFGFGETPIFYLKEEQANNRFILRKVHEVIMGLTRVK